MAIDRKTAVERLATLLEREVGRRTWHRCPVCGKRFSAVVKAIYCSNACKQKAKYRQRRKKKESNR